MKFEPNCASLLKSVAEGVRLAVLRRLLDGPKRVAELNAGLDVEQTLLSHHLRALREAGLVTSRREGKGVVYTLAKGVARRGRGLDLGCCVLSFREGA